MSHSQDEAPNSLDGTKSLGTPWRDYGVALVLGVGSIIPRLAYLADIPAVVFDEVCYTDLF